MTKREWSDKLSIVNKAEIQAAVIHILVDHMPEVWKKIPKWYQKQLNQIMYDCGVDIKHFTKKDFRQLKAYFKDFNEKCPSPKPKKTKA